MRTWIALALTLAVAAVLGLTAADLGSRGHDLTLPLDDAYIPLQYARTAASGEPFRYAPGEEPSTGATSPLWLLLTTAAALALSDPPPGEAGAYPAAALILCTLAAAGALFLAWDLARRHGAGPGAALAPGLLLLSPLVLFGLWNGMETGLYAASLLAGARVLAGAHPLGLLPLAAVRPEGAVLALGILALRLRPGRLPRSAWIPGAAALGTLLLPWLVTGGPSSAIAAKALWTEPDPEVRGFYVSRLPYFVIRSLGWGLSGGRVQPALDVLPALLDPAAWRTWMWAALLGGGAMLGMVRRRGRAPILLWVAATVPALGAVSWDAQFYRYLVPGFPLLAAGAVAGWTGGGRTLRIPGVGLALLLALAVLPGDHGLWPSTRRLYRGECERLAGRQVRVGEWIAANLPDTARVAVHDAGAIAFLGGRPVVDLVGLVDPGLAGAYRHGPGALWEALDALPDPRRPTHAAVIPAWMPYLARTFWFGDRLWPVRSRGGPPSQDFEVWRLSWPDRDPDRWPGGDRGNRPRVIPPGWEIVDALDVADLASERRHDLRLPGAAPTRVRDLGFTGSRVSGQHTLEGGRDITGAFAFELDAQMGRPARLVLRTASPVPETLTLRVGEWTGSLAVPRDETRFAEPGIDLPPDAVDVLRTGRLPVAGEGRRLRVFHVWLLQPVGGGENLEVGP